LARLKAIATTSSCHLEFRPPDDPKKNFSSRYRGGWGSDRFVGGGHFTGAVVQRLPARPTLAALPTVRPGPDPAIASAYADTVELDTEISVPI
jgi:hypothetical protein